jgi:hypothetical protein
MRKRRIAVEALLGVLICDQISARYHLLMFCHLRFHCQPNLRYCAVVANTMEQSMQNNTMMISDDFILT